MRAILELFKIAKIHAQRIDMALEELKKLYPFTQETIKSFQQQDFLLAELLVNRFGKLQDLIGTKLIDAFFEEKGEAIQILTMIDKLNKLEKLELIEDANIWLKMREIRNNLTHEYPDNPEITAENLNRIFELAPKLLEILYNLESRLLQEPLQ